MSKKVLLSIKPEFVEKIFSGEKKFEFRRVLPKEENITQVVVYSTKPVGKVVGEFTVRRMITEDVETLWGETAPYSGINYEYYAAYFNGRKKASAIAIGEVTEYEDMVELAELVPHGKPPQSFYYLD